ncbi:hypothetical protein [Globicatella sp. PHS-GS-PNBC-21-1553]|uniref:hypothetical protein n=1 Tax=Globicatella sp. PHS-GS-PNBC-21-1553 TaxID=2885764 RepID=UPI00298ED5F5|nr:hypothetical protein [Globicatella sp. PHS-GS-PNBC-21-1553]WPC08624.1 hypothetical protein LB888_11645 [Globicatella sp. PHS-GS-PNBC-21-1553]
MKKERYYLDEEYTELVAKLQDEYGIQSIGYDEERFSYVFAEPVDWILEADDFEINEEDFSY